MKLKIHSHNFAKNILSQEPFKQTYDELMNICKQAPIPIYKNKSANQKKLDVIQQIIDSYLNLRLKFDGWNHDEHFPVNDKEYLTIDYKKIVSTEEQDYNIHLEVEFGNVASTYRNYFKLQFLNYKKSNNIGVLILPTESLSKRIDSGIATYEKTVGELESANGIFNFPILVIGLDYNEEDELPLNTGELTLKEFQSKSNIKHEMFVRDFIKNIKA
ncbi:BglII/BstYI family type II restriction endonuclease [Peribacillus frigoritolerans]